MDRVRCRPSAGAHSVILNSLKLPLIWRVPAAPGAGAQATSVLECQNRKNKQFKAGEDEKAHLTDTATNHGLQALHQLISWTNAGCSFSLVPQAHSPLICALHLEAISCTVLQPTILGNQHKKITLRQPSSSCTIFQQPIPLKRASSELLY